MTHPKILAEKIAIRAAAVLEPMRVQMSVQGWDAEFRRIMWDAIANKAAAYARNADAECLKEKQR